MSLWRGTSDMAPITTRSPIVLPPRIVVDCPMVTFRPILTGWTLIHRFSTECARMTASPPMTVSSSM
jgi:hypothetical protein